jgi:hypothetical protein
MSRDDLHFFAVAFPVGLAGMVVAQLLGWGDTGTFLATMGPCAVVMAIFISQEGRESRKRKPADHGMQASAHRRS